jgi:hypothetical protein
LNSPQTSDRVSNLGVGKWKEMRWLSAAALCIGALHSACGDRTTLTADRITLTAPSALTVSGTWEGSVLVTQCETNWIDIRPCANRGPGPDLRRLVLTQVDGNVYGRIVRLFMNGGVIQAVEERATMVSGQITGNTLTLSGTFVGSAGVRDEEIIENWTTMVRAGRIDGTYDHRHIQQGTCFLDRCIDPIVWRRNYRVIELHLTNAN